MHISKILLLYSICIFCGAVNREIRETYIWMRTMNMNNNLKSLKVDFRFCVVILYESLKHVTQGWRPKGNTYITALS